MSRILFTLIAGTVMLAGSTLLVAADVSAVAPQPGAEPLADIAWIGRAWRSEHNGRIIEEIWSPPAGGSMTGMFRLVAGGQPRFYEFMSIEATGGGVFLHMHHFSPGLKRWEDTPQKWELAEATDQRATFEVRNEPDPKRLIFMKRGDDGIVIRLVDYENGKPVNKDFAMQAVH